MEYILLGVLVVIAIGLLILGIRKKKPILFVNFILRMAGGTLGIYLVNVILKSFELKMQVGINTYNLLTLGILGTPGFLLLYGISAYFTLKA